MGIVPVLFKSLAAAQNWSFWCSLVLAWVPGKGGGVFNKIATKFLRMGLEASPAFVLSPEVIELPVQVLDSPRDVPDIITGDRACLVRRSGLTSRIRTVWQTIPLVPEAESVSELEVGASTLRISPHRGSLLGNGRSDAEKASYQNHGSHRHSMIRGLRSVEGSHG
jgi:hypothetical protein